MTVHYATVDDTVWPINLGDIEWVLRYGDPTAEERLIAASVVAAYRHLTDSAKTQGTAIAALHRARRAAREVPA